MSSAPTTPAPDPAAQFAAKALQAQADALDTLHRVMLHLADKLTKPPGKEGDQQQQEEEPAQARTNTQRLRLCIQAARDILRLTHHKPDATTPRPPVGRVHPSTPSTRSAHSHSSLSTHSAQPTPPASPAPHPAASTDKPSSNPTAPPSPPPVAPKYFTSEEFRAIIATLNTPDALFTPQQYAQILEWNAYANAVGLSPSLGIKQHILIARKPPGADPPTFEQRGVDDSVIQFTG